MTDKELKKKIVGILKEAYMPKYHGEPTIYHCIDDEYAPEVYYPTDEDVADALSKLGLAMWSDNMMFSKKHIWISLLNSTSTKSFIRILIV